MHTILGAGGVIGRYLAKELGARGHKVRLVGRNPAMTAGASEAVAADLTDLVRTVAAAAGSSVVHLVAGLK